MSTGAAQNALTGLLPHPQTPWVLSDSLQKRMDATGNEGTFSYKKCLVLEEDVEWKFVVQAFGQEKSPQCYIKRVYCIYNPESTERFEQHLSENTERGEEAPHRKRAKLVKGSKDILFLWYGATANKISSICHQGFFISPKGKSGSSSYLLDSSAHDEYDELEALSGDLLLSFVSVKEKPKSGQVSIGNSAEALPAFWVEVQSDLPYSPALTPEPAERLFRFVVDVLRDPRIKWPISPKGKALLKEMASMIRRGIYPSSENSLRLIEQYETNVPFFRAHPFGSENSPFVDRLLATMKDWKKTFASEALFKVFPAVVEHLLKKGGGWEEGCEILFAFLKTSEEDTFPVLEKFLKERPAVSLAEFAFSTIQKVEQGVPLVEGAVANLLNKNSLPSEHERLYAILSKKPDLEPIRGHYLSLLPSYSSLFNRLANIPNLTGYRQKVWLEQNALIQQIEALSQEDPTSVKITSPFFEQPRYLKEEYINTKMVDGKLMTEICHIKGDGIDLHLKETFKPMHEYAVYSLASRISGEGIPPSTLVRFDVDLPGQEKISYPVLISQTIEGAPLEEVLNGKTPLFVNAPLTHLQLLGILIRPAEGIASHFVVKGGKIYSIHNETSFVSPIVEETDGKTIYFKSILYCLNQQALAFDVCEVWKALSPESICKGWVKDLIERENSYASLFTPEELEGLTGFTPYFVAEKGMLNTLYTQFQKLQQALRDQFPKNGLDLLNQLITLEGPKQEINVLGPFLYAAYNAARTDQPNPILRLETAMIPQPAMTVNGLGKVPTRKEIKVACSLEEAQREFNSYALFDQCGILEKGREGEVTLNVDRLLASTQQSLVLNGLKNTLILSQPQSVSLSNMGDKMVGVSLAMRIASLLSAITTLKELKLMCVGLPDAAYILSFDGKTRLRKLVLWESLKGVVGAKTLASILPSMASLTELDLGFNRMQNEGIIALSPALRSMASLTKLGLGGNEIDDEGVEALAAALPTMTSLKELELNSNGIEDEGVEAIVKALHGIKLTVLNLADNSICYGGAEAIAEFLLSVKTTLTVLDLSNNAIGALGVSEIAKVLPLMEVLETLDLRDTELGHEGAGEIGDILHQTTLRTINVWDSEYTDTELYIQFQKSGLRNKNGERVTIES